MQLWNTFAEKHPAAAKWVREGGLFVAFPEGETKKA
jgi:hypothetical protein